MDQHEREAATQRKRRERDRYRRRMRLSDRVEYPDDVTELLIDDRLLSEERSEDPKAVAGAMGIFLRRQAMNRRNRFRNGRF